MKGTDKHHPGLGAGESGDTLAELLRHAPARPRPPAEDEQAVRQALHAEWQQLTGRSRRGRRPWVWALAASLVLALVLLYRLPAPSPGQTTGHQLAQLEKVIGRVTLRSGESTHLMTAGQTESGLHAGQVLVTGAASSLAMRWANGASVRLDQHSELLLDDAGRLALTGGRLYMDTESALADSPALTVQTPHGEVQHLGTQFMTRVTARETAVSVRQGKVAFMGQDSQAATGHGSDQFSGEQVVASAGEELTVTLSGQVYRRSISAWGGPWEWTEALTSGFDADGRRMSELLDWVSRESGRQVDYQSDSARRLAEQTILHGHMDMPPLQALTVASATSDLVAVVEDGHIRVSLVVQP